MFKGAELVEEKIILLKKTTKVFGVTLEIDQEAIYYMKALHSRLDEIERIILKLLMDVKGKSNYIVHINLQYLEQELYKEFFKEKEELSDNENEAVEFLDNIEESICSIKDKVGDKSLRINIEEIAFNMKEKGYICSNANQNIKQFLYKDVRRLKKKLIKVLKNEIYDKKWKNTRGLLVFKKMIRN